LNYNEDVNKITKLRKKIEKKNKGTKLHTRTQWMMIQRLEPLSSFLSFVSIRLTFDLEPRISCSLTSAIGCDALEHAAILHGELLDL
jgi:hypothetical protein